MAGVAAPLPGRWRRFSRAWPLTLAGQFMIFSLAVLVGGAVLISLVTANAIRAGVVSRTLAVTALFVDSFIGPHLQDLPRLGAFPEEHITHLDSLIADTPLGTKIVSFKVWSLDGTILYATDRRLVGRTFPVGRGLRAAGAGDVHGTVSRLLGEENQFERERWPRLVETYAPVRKYNSDQVIGVAEFYQLPEELEVAVSVAQRRGWQVVTVATLGMYLLLNGMVRRASATIGAQNAALREMGDRLRRAAAQKSETDEQLLRRIARDLHDGPAQDISLALLRLDGAAAALPAPPGRGGTIARDLEVFRTALTSALTDLRAISAGLQLPELSGLPPAAVAAKAVELHQAKTGSQVALTTGDDLPAAVPAAVSIALFRVIQESLNNAFHHGQTLEQQVSLQVRPAGLLVEVIDHGVGFRPGEEDAQPGALGLLGMSERLALLGGRLTVVSEPGQGTRVTASVPLEKEA